MFTRTPDSACSIARTLEIVGDKWTFCVLREAFIGVRRFEAFQENLGIARNILTSRLNLLVTEGILERHKYQEHPPRTEYRLSEKGLDLFTVPMAFIRWGDRWLASDGGPHFVLTHRTCGHHSSPRMTCSNCGEELRADEVEYEAGPGLNERTQPRGINSRRSSFAGLKEEMPLCSVIRSLDIIGDRWTFLVLREAFYGVKRFEDFRQNMGIARNILSDRLKLLVAYGILEKKRYQTKPDRFEYHLSEKGLDLFPVPLALMRWGDRWLAGKAGPPTLLIHKTCGRHNTPIMTCFHCDRELNARDVRYEIALTEEAQHPAHTRDV